MTTWDWQFTWKIAPELGRALIVTLDATAMGFIIAVVLGMVWAILRRGRGPLAWAAHGVVEFIRSTPLLVQLFFIYYVLPRFGLRLSPLTAGVIGLGLHYSAYLAEVYRAGIEGVAAGQWEAATALSLSRADLWRLIILPQAIPPVIPVMGNYLIAMLKDSPLLSAITVVEILQQAKIIGSESFRYLEPLTVVGVLFLATSLLASLGVRWLERRLGSRFVQTPGKVA